MIHVTYLQWFRNRIAQTDKIDGSIDTYILIKISTNDKTNGMNEMLTVVESE